MGSQGDAEEKVCCNFLRGYLLRKKCYPTANLYAGMVNILRGFLSHSSHVDIGTHITPTS